MKTIDLMNYHDIFSKQFSKEEREEFLYSYEICIKHTFYESLTDDNSENSAKEFLKTWESKFKDRMDLLKGILLFLKPKEVYSILETCDK